MGCIRESIRSLVSQALLLLSMGLTPLALLGDPAAVSLPSQSAAPGSSIILPLTYQTNGEAISGIQFDIQYDNSAMSLLATLGDAAKGAGKVVYQADPSPNVRRILIVGLNSSPIPDGTLIGLFVNLNPQAVPGVLPLTFSNVTGTGPGGIPASVGGSDGAVTVSGTISQSVPLQAGGVLNGASLASGPLAPGEIFTLIGSNIGSSPESGNGVTQIFFDGFAASLFYVGTNQINGVAPFELTGHTITHIEIAWGGNVIAGLLVPVTPASPAIFTLDGSGQGQGAILNQDETVNSPKNPAARGDIVALFATGSGQTDPPSADGHIGGAFALKPAMPVSVQIGGIDAEVLYAGGAPGLINGVLQVNCRIPANVNPGYSVTVVLAVGSASSPRSVTLAVQ